MRHPRNPNRCSPGKAWRRTVRCPVGLLLLLWGCLHSIALAQPQPAPADDATTDRLVLWIFVLDYENQPTADVRLRCEISGTALQTLHSDAEGKILVRGSALGQIVRARIEDSNYLCYDETQEGEIGGNPMAFLVFPRRSGSGSREQQIAMHQAKIRAIVAARQQIQRRARAADAASSPALGGSFSAAEAALPIAKDPVLGNLPTRHITAFLAGLRHEDARGLDDQESSPSRTVSAEIRIIDGRGQPIPDALVSALVLDSKPEKGVSLAAIERSEADGSVVFRGLLPERWHRIECVDHPEGEGRSTLFSIPPGQSLTLRPLVIRPREQTVSGFVIHPRGPAAFARISLKDQNNNKVLNTIADAQGYFILGPTPAGPVMLDVAYRAESGGLISVSIPVERDTPEVLIPIAMDALPPQP